MRMMIGAMLMVLGSATVLMAGPSKAQFPQEDSGSVAWLTQYRPIAVAEGIGSKNVARRNHAKDHRCAVARRGIGHGLDGRHWASS
jgi:hypothetical protein